MARGAKISVDPDTYEFSVEFIEVGSTGFKEHETKVKIIHGNQLFNGAMEVEGPDGNITTYPDGCHIVQVPAKTGIITHMNKADYAAKLGGPGTENQD